MDAKHKHLEFIQGAIDRLASDSFRIKGWSVVLVAALLILFSWKGSTRFAPLASLVPVLAFWGLDGYFLWQERLFRALYDHVRRLDEGDIDYAMNVGPFRTGGGGGTHEPGWARPFREPSSAFTAHSSPPS